MAGLLGGVARGQIFSLHPILILQTRGFKIFQISYVYMFKFVSTNRISLLNYDNDVFTI